MYFVKHHICNNFYENFSVYCLMIFFLFRLLFFPEFCSVTQRLTQMTSFPNLKSIRRKSIRRKSTPSPTLTKTQPSKRRQSPKEMFRSSTSRPRCTDRRSCRRRSQSTKILEVFVYIC